MVSLFATEMLEQVVLFGHGGSGENRYLARQEETMVALEIGVKNHLELNTAVSVNFSTKIVKDRLS